MSNPLLNSSENLLPTPEIDENMATALQLPSVKSTRAVPVFPLLRPTFIVRGRILVIVGFSHGLPLWTNVMIASCDPLFVVAVSTMSAARCWLFLWLFIRGCKKTIKFSRLTVSHDGIVPMVISFACAFCRVIDDCFREVSLYATLIISGSTSIKGANSSSGNPTWLIRAIADCPVVSVSRISAVLVSEPVFAVAVMVIWLFVVSIVGNGDTHDGTDDGVTLTSFIVVPPTVIAKI